eukprot:c15257_g1_i1.p1 GENE.c15257_g1_i1~~c15257_g1_i1.p1  ORF type:complete len:499 (+),score=81.67 c15257_g1_i1:140-1498(+)
MWARPSHLWFRSVTVCVISIMVGTIQVLSLIGTNTVHQCTDPLSHLTLSETTNLGRSLCGWVWTSCVLCSILNICGVLWLRHLNQFYLSPRSPFGEFLMESPIRVGVGSTPIWWKAGLWATWIGLVLAMSIPSFLNLAVSSLPAKNTIGVQGFLAKLIQFFVSPLLVLASDTLIPKLCVWFVRQYHGEVRTPSQALVCIERQPGSDPQKTQRTSSDVDEDESRFFQELREAPDPVATELILVSQLVLLVVLPLVARVVFDEHCLGVARTMWVPCQPNRPDFNVTVSIPVMTDQKLEEISVPVLTQSDVCDISWDINDLEMCVRGVIAGSSSLVISKVIVQTLMSMARGSFHELLRWLAWEGVLGGLYRLVSKKPNDLGVTQSIISLMLLGFAFGAMAPFVWVVVLLKILSTRMGPHQSSRPKLRIPRMLLAGPLIQIVMVVWFLATVDLCSS